MDNRQRLADKISQVKSEIKTAGHMAKNEDAM